MNDDTQKETHRIDRYMALAPLHLFTAILAAHPPFEAVLTDWLSRMATEGRGFLPTAERAASRSAVFARSHTPLRLQRYR